MFLSGLFLVEALFILLPSPGLFILDKKVLQPDTRERFRNTRAVIPFPSDDLSTSDWR